MNRRKARSVAPPAWRRVLVLVLLLALPVVLMARAVSLQLIDGPFLQGQGEQRHLRVESLPAHRGTIRDRQGQPLAISAPVDSVWADPRVTTQEASQQDLAALARRLDTDPARLRSDLSERRERAFFYLERHVSPDLAARVSALDVPGVALQREYRRFYPTGEVSGHVLGFTNIDDHGQEGVELAYDDWLSGEPGAKRVLRDRHGRNIEDVERLREPDPGHDLTLTLDKRLQYVAYRELKAAVERHQAASGSIVLMDADNGDILAMANQPSFNPNRRSEMTGGRYRNRAVTDTYEPGSVVKPFTVLAALRTGRYTPETVVETAPGVMRVGGHQVRDVRNFGELTVAGVLRKSSNVGAAQMALSLESGQVWQTLNSLGIGEPSGVGLPGDSAGRLSSMPSERPIERATLAFGYGLSVSNLQLARAYSAIASGGELPTPALIADGRRPDPERVMSARRAAQLREMLTAVTESGGTATQAAIPGYQVAGKTGTSRKAVSGGYAEDRYISTFAGMAPASDPRFVAVVTIDEPRGDAYYAGPVAGPVFAAVMGDALRLYNVMPDAAFDQPGLTVAGGESP
jgi:cell division protein FtsI (penicillin-binding protein 3)